MGQISTGTLGNRSIVTWDANIPSTLSMTDEGGFHTSISLEQHLTQPKSPFREQLRERADSDEAEPNPRFVAFMGAYRTLGRSNPLEDKLRNRCVCGDIPCADKQFELLKAAMSCSRTLKRRHHQGWSKQERGCSFRARRI